MAGLDDRDDRTIFVGNLDRSCEEVILYELFVQAGPLIGVKIPKERESGEARGFAFVEFKHDVSVPYALHLLNGTSLYGRQLNLKYRKGSKHEQNPHQGPPPQVFPKGFPNPLTVSEPPNVQRTLLPLPMPNYQFDPSLSQGQAMEIMQKDRFRGSPVPDVYCSPVSQASPQSFPGSYGQQSYEDVRPSSRGQFRGTPPGSRDHSPRWAGNSRGERPRSEDRRQGHRNTEFARNESYPHHSHRERHHHHHHHSREDERHHQRSRTVDDHQRGLNGGHHFRDRSVEDFNRRNTGFRSNDGYRHQYHR